MNDLGQQPRRFEAQGGAPHGREDALQEVTPDVAQLRTTIANVVFVGEPGARDGEWVLIDAGVPGSAGRIVKAAERRFGTASRPAAIVLTHGHFDHVGALRDLVKRWNAPVYAHSLEMPYLRGESPYPPPDPTVGGGMMARMAPLYPRAPVDVSDHLRALPEGGAVPPLPGWRWLHTPGHTAGHVSLFRERDRALIVGDAFVTVRQESATDVLQQRPEVSGPPAYFTQDWPAARGSVERLMALQPTVAVTGHGPPMRGTQLTEGLQDLARNFDRVAVPPQGRYVERPVVADEHGLVFVPPPRRAAGRSAWATLGMVLLAGALMMARRVRRESSVRSVPAAPERARPPTPGAARR